jgi:hypothetical protein
VYIGVAHKSFLIIHKFLSKSSDPETLAYRLNALLYVGELLDGVLTIKEVPQLIRMHANDLFQRLRALEDSQDAQTPKFPLMRQFEDISTPDFSGYEPQVGEEPTQEVPALDLSPSSTDVEKPELGRNVPEVPEAVGSQSQPVLSGFRGTTLPQNYCRGACFISQTK